MDQLTKPTLQPARLNRRDVPPTYNRLAPFHDLMAHMVERKARLRAFQLARLENGQDVLEVGVGTGLNMSFVLERNPDGTYVGIDVAPGMLERARRRLHRLATAGLDRVDAAKLDYRLLPGDAYGLEFAD
ncbi:MAG: class I SAM-dependent methyltransferase, partial [Rhodothermales bacterium]|nr:class I SAM-dependent methyltransferase [Rhodothermales bacterium]